VGLTLITPPASMPVSLALAKQHVEYEDDDRDDLISGLIEAATDFVELNTGRSILTQTWRFTLDEFSDSIQLPKGPVQSLVAITYFDANGDIQTLPEEIYTFDNSVYPSWVVLNSDSQWPELVDAVNAVRIDFVVGYTSPPASIVQAILLLVDQWFNNRSAANDVAMSEMPLAVKSLLGPYQRMMI
jgi:uncharacterized phiE125 gp8 family phage protein